MEQIVEVKRKTAADAVYEQLKEDIITLYYKPGEKLSEVKIARRYNVSRDPVRKGISRLVQEGLLVSKPQYGTIVCNLSIEQGQEICDVRLILEVYAVKMAIGHIPEGQMKVLLENLEKAKKALAQDSEDTTTLIYKLDGELHSTIWNSCGNNMIGTIIKSYDSIVRRIQISNMMYRERKQETMAEMEKIILSLKDNDERSAEEAMRTHIANIKKTLVQTNTEKKEK
ncbi:MAG: GntR family transcriptional regulator [Sphaerochaetaceae bacterium]|nr:GntR family transcriptional regulator [Sphaerochaetaceae bacterium]